jgi:pyruvate/2-oxoglutarate dehydrogenase complex dihydrolipoamide dehydrogenase (E3) component
VFINTGGRPARPDVPGAADIGALDSTSIMELDEVPAHLLVIGGGYIGLEFAQMFGRFGARVTIVQRGAQLLPLEDADIAGAVTGILREDCIEVLTDTEPARFERRVDGVIAATLRGEAGERAVEASHVLFAAGRVPNTDALDPAAGGIETDGRGYIRVNAKLETTSPGVYALGDVKGGPAFTHISYDDYRILRTNLLEDGDASTDGRLLPYTVFIDPQLGRVGMTEAEARKQGRDIRIAKMPMSHVARALEMDESRGVMKVVVDAATDRILGCAVLGIEGGEIMSTLQVAMMGDLPFTALREGIFAHPTLAESLNNLFNAFDD